MNTLKKYAPRVNAVKAAAGTSLITLGMSAQAALPEGVKTALEGAKTDGMEAGWLVVGIIAALFVIAIVKRLLR